MAWSTESRHTRGYGTNWDKLRKQIMVRDKHLCQPCLSKDIITPAREVDHIIPKAKGGDDQLSNLQAICTECHKDKTAVDEGRVPRKVEFGPDGRVVW